MELALCLKVLIASNYLTLGQFNKAILSFPYKHFDKVDRPHPIPASFASCGTIGGIGQENALLRLLPLFIGSNVPERNRYWEVLMDLILLVKRQFST